MVTKRTNDFVDLINIVNYRQNTVLLIILFHLNVGSDIN